MTRLVPLILAGEVAILIVLILAELLTAISGHAVARQSAACDRARQTLLTAMACGNISADALSTIQALPRRRQVSMIADLALNVHGEQDGVLLSVAEAVGVFASAKKALGHRHWSERLAGIRLLRALSFHDPGVECLLSDRNRFVRSEAARYLANVDPSSSSAEHVSHLLVDSQACVRNTAREALAAMGTHASDVVCDVIRNGTPALRRSALRIATAIPDPRIHLAARDVLPDPDPWVRAAALDALATSSTKPDRAAVLGALEDGDPVVRTAAARALGAMQDPATVRQLARMSRDEPDDHAREAARRALLRLGPAGRLALHHVLSTAEASVRPGDADA